jgi:hypothetical protein
MLGVKKGCLAYDGELTNKLYGAESFLTSHHSLSYPRISQSFMEPEGSLPCSKELATGPYPEPDKSSPNHSILFL